jgi:hypothetical protein
MCTLWEPITIGTVKLPSRFAIAPITFGAASRPTAQLANPPRNPTRSES